MKKNLNEVHKLQKIAGILKESIDLHDRSKVIAWMDKNAPESIFDKEGTINWNYTDPNTGDDLETLVSAYMEKYNEVNSEYEIELYRLVKLDSLKQLDTKNVGTFWSFDKNAIGAYGVGKNFTGSKPYELTAIIKTDNIDWEQGFYSFLAYGKSEFECYIKKGSDCLITNINEKELDTPIEATC